ncbi:sugar transferase [Rubritalea tangerina]|uniref:sugar transferase n=1 Tax=Rubritalea tangerina TaxID=430798 RepID=UPI0036103AAA
MFKQERTGLREESFMILKFRSMRVGSEKGPKYTSTNDDRFTPIGKFIRKTRLWMSCPSCGMFWLGI